MKVTIESTPKIIEINGVPARVWQGQTESGVAVIAFLTRIAAQRDADLAEFEADLQEAWHGVEAFGRDRSRGDGRMKWCRAYNNSRGRARYAPRPRPDAGRRFVEARSGDAEQARRRVNHLVDAGFLPRPDALPCTDCGHIYALGERRHEYDHFRGYDAAHHEDVEAVCTTCHHVREHLRRAA